MIAVKRRIAKYQDDRFSSRQHFAVKTLRDSYTSKRSQNDLKFLSMRLVAFSIKSPS